DSAWALFIRPLPDTGIHTASRKLAIEGKKSGGGATAKIAVHGICPHDVGFPLKAYRHAQEIEQPAVSTGCASQSHSADCAKVVRNLGHLAGGETRPGIRRSVHDRVQALCHHHRPVSLNAA